MARQHKFAGSQVAITTRLPADRVAEISRMVGDNTRGDILIGLNNVRFEGAGHGRTNFSIRALGNRLELMTFHVAIESRGSGSAAMTHIDTYKTSQQRAFGFIPVAPKRMSAYRTYRRFIDNFGAAVRAEEPAARVAFTERVSR